MSISTTIRDEVKGRAKPVANMNTVKVAVDMLRTRAVLGFLVCSGSLDGSSRSRHRRMSRKSRSVQKRPGANAIGLLRMLVLFLFRLCMLQDELRLGPLDGAHNI